MNLLEHIHQAKAVAPGVLPKEAAQPTKESEQRSIIRPGSKESKEYEALVQVALPWIREHQQALIVAGWSRKDLFSKSKFRYPSGPWGLAWCHCWQWPDVDAKIISRGDVIFSKRDAHGKVVSQRAKPTTPCAHSGA